MAAKFQNGIDLLSQRGVNVGDPSSAQDIATKNYVDNVARGLDWKNSVRVATTGNITVASAAPTVVDGVTLVLGDRILAMNQTAGAENGIYTVTTLGTGANGVWTRAVDADASSEVTSGMAASVTEGTANGDKTFVLTTNDPITLGTTALVFSQLGGGGSTYTASLGVQLVSSDFRANLGAGLTLSGNTIVPDYTVIARKVAFNVGDGTSTSISLAHNLATYDVNVEVFLNSGNHERVYPDVLRGVDTNHVELVFATAPASSAYRAVVVG